MIRPRSLRELQAFEAVHLAQEGPGVLAPVVFAAR
jgi:hypothetical protein